MGVYDFSLPESESTDPIRKINTSYKTLFNNEDDKHSYMIKISNTSATTLEYELMKYVAPLVKDYENLNRVMLRIQTNPWRHSCHFDTYDQTVVMMDGVKKWIFFKPKFDDIEQEKSFIKHVNGLKLEKLQEYLKSENVSYYLKTSKAGDTFFIPKGVYHAVENVNEGPGTIFLNVVYEGFDQVLDERFTQIWPSMADKCDMGVFY
jgi:hypothetical protein